MLFEIERTDDRFTVYYTDHQGRRQYFRATHASSAYGMVVEGLKVLADVRPHEEVTVHDSTGGYVSWLTTNSTGGKRRILGLPAHSVTG